MKKNNSELTNTKNYNTFLLEIKKQIKTSQVKAISSVNFEMTALYYKIGKALDKKQRDEGWGAKVIEKLSIDLKNEIPKLQGFSRRNMILMVQFYKEYQDIEIVQLPVAQDDVLAHENDNPTIGLILCQEKDEIVAEYSLRNMSQPIGISEYELTEVLPKEFVSSLPTIEMLENEFLNIEDKN